MYFQISCKNSCHKTIEATLMKKAPNESKLIFYCSFLVSVDFLCQSFKHTDKLKMSFFGDVYVNENRDEKNDSL